MFNSTISSLLQVEDSYTLTFDYFKVVKSIDIEMRSTLLTWMLEVCEEEKCTNDVFSLAVNLFDRFMASSSSSSSICIDKSHLQLIGITCLLIASKIKSTSLNSIKLIEYTAHTFTLDELLQFELFILDALKWDVASICPNDFLDTLFLLDEFKQLNLTQEKINLLHKHSHAFTALCSIDFTFAFYPPSIIASTCFMAALQGISNASQSFTSTLVELIRVDLNLFDHVLDQVKSLFKAEFTSTQHQNETFQFDFSLSSEESIFMLEMTQCDTNCSISPSPSPSKYKANNKFSSQMQQTSRKSTRRLSGRARG